MKKSLLTSVFLLLSVFVFAQSYRGKVVGIKDGDTVVLLIENTPQTIRLEHIDAPEKNQPYGARAKQFASGFCFGKTVVVMGNGKKDRNGRWIGEIFYNNQNLGKELVRNGLAWHYKRYSKSANYADLEIAARKKNKGLWQDKDPVAPWNWRKSRKKKV
ncbi:MAG: thermonuclease family protein [Kaistella sp.]